MAQEDPKARLIATVPASRSIMKKVANAFRGEWALNPGTGTRAALGKWVVTAKRHLVAITVLAVEHDLSTVAHVHQRQIFEIMLQVRQFAQTDQSEHERLAQKISASGCLEFLDKLEPVKTHPEVRAGYQTMTDQLSRYDPQLVAAIKAERSKQRFNWFATSFSDLARRVSRPGEDLASAYRIISGELHGVWDLTIGVVNPAPGNLDFRGYPDLATLYRWAADLVDEATLRYVQVWNEVAVLVGSEVVILDPGPQNPTLEDSKTTPS